MNPSLFTSLSLLAEVGHPLFGNQWLALAVILVGVAMLLLAVAAFGRWAGATHPALPPAPPAAVILTGPTHHTLAAIAAAVTAVLGAGARIAAVRTLETRAPGVEALMQQWSLEGRRQIYSSHKVR